MLKTCNRYFSFYVFKLDSKVFETRAQMWSEWIPTVSSMQRQIFPRLAVYAEVGWTNIENKDFERFQVSLNKVKETWSLLDIYFYKESDENLK